MNDLEEGVNVAEMQAGLELDALIAERVMGWTWKITRCNPEQRVLVDPYWTNMEVGFWWGRDVLHLVPHYSTEIEAAWDVFERLPAGQIYHHRGGDFSVYWGNARHTSAKMNVRADTAPLAICLAALAAVEP